MATKASVTINEILYFLSNNVNLLEVDNFISNVSDFYSSEDISDALKLIKYNMEILKIEKIPKSGKKSTTKKEKIQNIVSIIKHLQTIDVWKCLPTYVSADIKKIPQINSIINVNFNEIKCEIKDLLYKQELYIAKLLENLNFKQAYSGHNCVVNSDKRVIGHPLHVQPTIDTSVKLNVNKTFEINKKSDTTVELNVEKMSNINNNSESNEKLSSDFAETPTEENALPYTQVNRRKKRPRLNNSDNVKNAKNSTKKCIGNKVIENCKLKAEKEIIMKKVFSLSNVQKCHKNDVTEFLTTSGIRVVSCYPVFKRADGPKENFVNKDDEESSMFRVCIESSDSKKILDPVIMLKNVIVRKWKFHPIIMTVMSMM